MREAVAHRLVEAAPLQLVEIGHVAAALTVCLADRLVEVPLPGRAGRLGSRAGSSTPASSSAICTSRAWTIPAMPSLIVRRYCSSAVDEHAWIEVGALAAG